MLMMRMLVLFFLQSLSILQASDFLSTIKGVGSGIKDFGKHMGSMVKDFGEDFTHGKIGKAFESLVQAPPGYTYKFTILNDTDQIVYCKVQDYGSFMGGMFPIHGKADIYTVNPFQQYPPMVKDYYFQMSIAADKINEISSMPYGDANGLFFQDCTQLPSNKQDTKLNYFRTFIGKNIRNGRFVHGIRAEFIGANDASNKKDSGISVGSTISSLVIYNNSSDDIVIGYSSSKNQSLTIQNCEIISLIEKNSFAILSATDEKLLNAGSLGLFQLDIDSIGDLYGSKQSNQSPEIVFTFPQKVVSDKTYTLEIYQDQNDSSRKMGLQGIMPGNYDMPIGRVRDITPIHMNFWYKSVADLDEKTLAKQGVSKSNYVDLPGQVWMAFKENNSIKAIQIPLGTVADIIMFRPTIAEGQRWHYFIYVDTTDTKVAKQFVEKCIAGTIGKDVFNAYSMQAEIQIQQAIAAQNQAKSVADIKNKDQVSEQLLLQAIKGALAMHQGVITDTTLNVEGYFLGGDIFFPYGAGGQSTYYYQLNPSNNLNTSDSQKKIYFPTTAVTNQYAYTLGGSKPKGMPATTKTFNFIAPS